MIKIIYCPEGDAFSEFVVEEYIDNLVKMFKRNHFYPNKEKVFKFSTEMPINCIVYHVLIKNIPIDMISFWDGEQNMPCDIVCGLETDPRLNWNIGKFSRIIGKLLAAGCSNIKKIQANKKE